MVYSKLLSSSGVSGWLATQLNPWVAQDPYRLLVVLFVLTILLAQVVNTVACELIMFPLAVTLMYLARFEDASSLHAIGAILTVASCTYFLSLMGYQVNTIIYSQGDITSLILTRLAWLFLLSSAL